MARECPTTAATRGQRSGMAGSPRGGFDTGFDAHPDHAEPLVPGLPAPDPDLARGVPHRKLMRDARWFTRLDTG